MPENDQGQFDPLAGLHRQWAGLIIITSLAWLGAYVSLRSWWGAGPAARWLALSAPVMLYLLASLRRLLPHNQRVGEGRLLNRLGVGNLMSVLRGVLLAWLAGWVLSPLPVGWMAWLPGALYTLAALIDLVDGYAARRTNQATRLGELLDMQLDGLGVLVAALLTVNYRQVPAWYLLVALARYLFLAGIALRKRLGLPVYELPERASRRPFAGFQMGFLAVVLWPLFTPPATHWAAALFAAPFLIGFGYDWLLVSGSIGPAGQPNLRRPSRFAGPGEAYAQWVKVQMAHWISPLLRGALVASLGTALTFRTIGFPNLPARQPILWPVNGTSSVALGLAVMGAMLLAFGVTTRLGALLILFSSGLLTRGLPLAWPDYVAITCAVTLFYLGSGSSATWKAEESLLYRRLGETYHPKEAR